MLVKSYAHPDRRPARCLLAWSQCTPSDNHGLHAGSLADGMLQLPASAVFYANALVD